MKNLLLLLTIGILIITSCTSKDELCYRDYHFEIPIAITPQFDSIKINESFIFEMSIDDFSIDSFSNQEINISEFNFEIFFNRLYLQNRFRFITH